MAKNTINNSCFLCGTPAVCIETDAGNRKLYRCRNPDCGDYEISVTAMRRLENSAGHKEDMMQLAHSYQDTERFVEIIVGPDNQVVAQAVARSRDVS